MSAAHPKKWTKLSREEHAARRDAAAERLHTAASALLTSDGWKAALKFASRVNRRRIDGKPYSFANLMLISQQRPDATMVMTFEAWKEMGRPVKLGEKGLFIRMPINTKGSEKADAPDVSLGDVGESAMCLTGKDRDRTRFVLRPKLFDVSQTSGDPLPILPKPCVLDLPMPEIERHWDATAQYLIERIGCSITQESHQAVGGTSGYWRAKDKLLWVSPDLPRTEQFAVLLHEGGHALAGHSARVTRKEYDFQEVVAESTAFLVLDHFGVPADDHSVPYLAPYAKEPEVLLPAIQQALTIAFEFTTGIEKILKPEVAVSSNDESPDASPRVTAVAAGPTARVHSGSMSNATALLEDAAHV